MEISYARALESLMTSRVPPLKCRLGTLCLAQFGYPSLINLALPVLAAMPKNTV